MAKIEYADVVDDPNYGNYAPFFMFGSGIVRSGSATSFTIEGREDVSLEFVGTGFEFDGKTKPTAGFATSCIIRVGDEIQAVVTDIDVSAKELRKLNDGEKFFDLLGPIKAVGSVDRDYIIGGEFKDRLSGGDEDDIIIGSGGKDRLFGDDGDDLLAFGKGKAVLDGGDGNDTTGFSPGLDVFGENDTDLTIDLNVAGFQKVADGVTVKFKSIELVFGGDGDDRIVGDAEDNLLGASGGDDTVSGGGGDDVIYLDEGNDVLDGGDGIDTLYVASNDESGAKVSLAKDGPQKTGLGKDTITGFENINSGFGDDKLTGDANGNTIRGGDGNDTITGGGGRDGFYGEGGDDVFRFNAKSVGLANKADIADFGDNGVDVMDLSAIDANTAADGDQDFMFIDQGAFTGVAGQLRWEFFGGDPSRDVLITGDIDGDGAADLFIQLTSPTRALTIADFDL